MRGYAKRSFMPKALKGGLIGVGAVVLSTIAIQASDLVRGIEGSFPGLVSESDQVCGDGAVLLQISGGSLCVDQHEASPDPSCPHMDVTDQPKAAANMLDTSCESVSEAGRMPWRFVSLSEAQQLCARSGKRLPTNEEWHRISLGLVDQSDCYTNADTSTLTGSQSCVTDAGVHDLVGNVWEWVDESVTNGVYSGRDLPQSGFVSSVDNNGVVVTTSASSSDLYGQDYAWTNSEGVFGVIRGGFFSSGSDAGIFAQNLSVPFDLRTSGVGFRCVENLY